MSFSCFCRAAAQDALLQLLLLIPLLPLLLLLQNNASIIAISTCQEITSDLTLQQICYLHNIVAMATLCYVGFLIPDF